MFYSQFILAKKGPLGTIWIAAHLERKLRKNQVTETNIGVSVDSILFPEVPIALRLSGHLLLGVVRIYSRKVNYLFHDCSEALVKIKQAFHSGAVDLPPEAATAPIHAITLPENFDLDDLELLPDREALFLANSSIDHHVTSREQITLQDTVDDTAYGSQFGLDDRLDAPRLEFDEDVIPVKPRDDEEEEENARLEEDNLTMAEDDHQLDDEKLEEQSAPETADAHIQDLPDLNEEHPPEVEAAEATGLENMDTSNVLEETNLVPEMVSSEETGEKQAAGMTVPEDEQKSEGSPVARHEELPVEHQAVSASKEASTEGEAVPDMNDKSAEEIEVADIDKASSDKEPLETEKANQTGTEAEELMQDVPEIEKVRSSADAPELGSALHEEDPTKAKEAEETPVLKHDGRQEVEETPILKQDAPSEVRTSPRVSEFGGDDDILASILGRRSLKVAPTPDLPPAKRQKPGPKPASKKRKVHLDEATVLHSDDMRQQLSDTNAVRRVRKRAPCSEQEIWNTEREVHGQQMFDEPVVLGFCDKVRELYRSLWDAKRPVEPETSELTAKQKHQLEYEETEEAITLAEEPLDDYLFYDMQSRYPFEELNTAKERDSPMTAPTPRAMEAQPLEEATPPRETDGSAGESKETSPPAEKLDVKHAVEAEDDNQASERTPPSRPLLEDNGPEDVGVPTLEALPDVSNVSAEAPVNNSEQLQEEHTVNDSSRIETPADPEGADTSKDPETEMHVEETVASDETIEEQNTVEQAGIAVTDVANVQIEEQPLAESEHGHVTAEGLGFLTDAKDEEADDGENGDVEYVEPQVQDSNGWSVRTRAVCQYLRVTFENMEGSKKEKAAPAKIGLERLLQGKTRRESARMFFESLVLKTKDYINVEQDAPFDNIYITARSKLMKADM